MPTSPLISTCLAGSRALMVAAAVLVCPAWGVAQDGEDTVRHEASLMLPDWLQPPDGYMYQPEDKPDPFQPFVQPVEPEQTFQPRALERPLTPLERVEATQLRVVGIVSSPGQARGALAMVELPDGKGYILRPGVGVGRYGGTVQIITPREVIIEEQGLDVAGREQTREIVLKLHPSQGDGDEQ